MNIKILYDNRALDNYISGWGLSLLIDDETLFDTGENAESLLVNMDLFNVRHDKIKNVVLSHADWDHVGGITVLKDFGKINVFVPAGTSVALKTEILSANPEAVIREALRSTQIGEGSYLTATMGDRKKEISLFQKTSKGFVLVTGCAHPGLENILAKVLEKGSVHMVIGGFHGFSKKGALSDVERIIPCHCTKMVEEIKLWHPEQTIVSAAGMEINVA